MCQMQPLRDNSDSEELFKKKSTTRQDLTNKQWPDWTEYTSKHNVAADIKPSRTLNVLLLPLNLHCDLPTEVGPKGHRWHAHPECPQLKDHLPGNRIMDCSIV